MTSISNKDFIDFLENYKKVNPKYFDTVTEISWPKNKKGETDRSKNPLIPDNSYCMLSLDDICNDCTKFKNNNTPSTTDALWYNLTDDNKLVLYFIEFKWHDLDNQKDQKIMQETFLKLDRGTKITPDMKEKFKKLYRSYSDEDVSFKLRLKPFESIYIVLPALFEEYCEKENKNFNDLHDFLVNCDIKVFAFVSSFTRPKIVEEKKKKSMRVEIDQTKKSKRNKSHRRMDYNRKEGPKGTIGSTVYKQYKRLEITPLINFADIFEREFFDTFLKDEDLLKNQ